MFKLLNYLVYTIFILVVFTQSAFSLPAFPGAEGFGSETPGGRGGKVIAVTNLNDSGPGSLREALTASGPRIVVFRVAGTIEIESRIAITEPYLTVAGQTAPGDGITIKSHDDNYRGPIQISTHDVIIRHLRIRPGGTPSDDGEIDAITVGGDANNFIIDHSSFSWATDEVIQTGRAHDFTIQWSIIAEGLSNSTHPKGEHSKGLHFRSDSRNVSIHHNLLAHNYDRNPNINSTGLVDMVNNVIYNGVRNWVEVKDKFGNPKVNLINNYFKRGPNSRPIEDTHEVSYYAYNHGFTPELFVSGNIGFHRPTNDLPEDSIVREDSRSILVNEQFPASPITTTSAVDAFELVLNKAGATLPLRDAHDQRVIQDVRDGAGQLIDHPSDVGGWLVMAPGTSPIDTDGDGMPDEWEIANSLNPNDPADGKQDRDGDGYTNVEDYLNSIVVDDSATQAPPPHLETTPPVVSLSDPKDESTVSGTVVISADATDTGSGVAGVQFKLDGNNLGAEDIEAPFSILWDSTSVAPGTYFLSALAWDKEGNETESNPVSVVVDPVVQPPMSSSGAIYVSTRRKGTVTNGPQCNDIDVSFYDEDILAYDKSGCWSLYFDGSSVGLSSMYSFHIMTDRSILFTKTDDDELPDVGFVDSSDIVRFIPTSLGENNTAGVFELYFKGSNVGLGPDSETNGEKIDAISFLPDGRLVISTNGSFKVPGISGKDEDLIAFAATSLGENTSGNWQRYFDGSDVGIGNGGRAEDVEGVSVSDTGDIFLTTNGVFSVPGLSGDGGDILRCAPLSTGASTSCNFDLFWRGSEHGLSGHSFNGIQVAP